MPTAHIIDSAVDIGALKKERKKEKDPSQSLQFLAQLTGYTDKLELQMLTPPFFLPFFLSFFTQSMPYFSQMASVTVTKHFLLFVWHSGWGTSFAASIEWTESYHDDIIHEMSSEGVDRTIVSTI